MGGSCVLDERGLTFTGGGRIHGIDIDLGEVGELTPGIAAVAALAESESVLRGVGHLRLHETDRLAALVKEINGLGGDVTETEDGLRIRPRPLHGGVFHTYDDHRLATAGAVLGLAVEGVEVENVATTYKTLPDFPRMWDELLGLPFRGREREPERAPAMRRYGKHTDEDDIRVRPSRRGSRPRTHTRPKHEDAAEGLVLTVDRGRLTCLVEERTVTAMKARELGRKAVVVGDRVAVVGDLSGEKDTLARVVRVAERSSVLRRTADDNDPYERVVVANADQLAVVTALADPEPRPRLIDRCLVAAFDAGLEPLLVLTKSDLAPAGPLLETYAPLGVRHVVTSRADLAEGPGAEEVRELLRGRTTVCVGHSGVGKTTLVNALVERQRATGVVNAVTGARTAHHDLGAGAAAAAVPDRRGRLGDRHPGGALLRPEPHPALARHPRLPRSGGGRRRLPSRLQPQRARLRARPLGGRRARRPGPPALAAPPAGDAGEARRGLTDSTRLPLHTGLPALDLLPHRSNERKSTWRGCWCWSRGCWRRASRCA